MHADQHQKSRPEISPRTRPAPVSRLITLLAGLLLAALAIAAPSVLAQTAKTVPAGQTPDGQTKASLRIALNQFPSSFHPAIDSMVAKSYIMGFARRPLTTVGPDWKIVCMLCTQLPKLENGRARKVTLANGKQGIELTVTLKKDAVWGDGTPLTTKDIIFTWKVGRHPQSGVGNAEGYRRILSITAKDDKTFVMRLDRITFNYYDLSGFDPLPAHLEAKPFADPIAYRKRTLYDTATTNPGLYNGPYVVSKVSAGAYIVLTRNPRWWGKKPAFKQIVIRVITNTAALEAALLSNSVDYIAGELGLTLDQALGLEKRAGKRFRFVYKPGLLYEHIDLNLSHPALKDRRVRQALLYGLDRETLVRSLFKGKQPVAHSSVHPLDSGAFPGLKKYAFNPRKAAALLDAAGWKKRGRYRVNKDGKPLRLTLMTTAGNRVRELVQQVLQAYWRRLGIDVRIKNEPARVFFGVTVTQRKFTGLAMFAWASSPENVPRTTLHSTQIPTAANNWSGQNYTGFRDAAMDDLLDRIEVELDPAKRKTLWHQLQTRYVSELPVLPLYFRANAYVLPKWLQGITPTGHQFPSSLWAEYWHAGPAPNPKKKAQ